MDETTDISKQTLVVLVALSCIISVIGVIALVYELSTSQTAPTTVTHQQASAEAGFVIGHDEPGQVKTAAGLATFQVVHGSDK